MDARRPVDARIEARWLLALSNDIEGLSMLVLTKDIEGLCMLVLRINRRGYPSASAGPCVAPGSPSRRLTGEFAAPRNKPSHRKLLTFTADDLAAVSLLSTSTMEMAGGAGHP